MIISRVKVGWLIIAGSILMFSLALAADVSDNSEPLLDFATFTAIENLLFFLSLISIAIGVYFVRSSKACLACGEKVASSDPDCKYCGYVFKNNRATHTEHSATDNFILKKFAKFILKAAPNKAEHENNRKHRDPMPAGFDSVLGNLPASRETLTKVNTIAAACKVALALRTEASRESSDSRRDADTGEAQVEPHRSDVEALLKEDAHS